MRGQRRHAFGTNLHGASQSPENLKIVQEVDFVDFQQLFRFAEYTKHAHILELLCVFIFWTNYITADREKMHCSQAHMTLLLLELTVKLTEVASVNLNELQSESVKQKIVLRTLQIYSTKRTRESKDKRAMMDEFRSFEISGNKHSRNN